ncbi:hypothetical protein ACN6QN_14570, partial [Acinetobacter baumannii]
MKKVTKKLSHLLNLTTVYSVSKTHLRAHES